MGLRSGRAFSLTSFSFYPAFADKMLMRLLPLLLVLVACSHTSLKYKYSFSKKYLASLTSEETQVKKVEISLKDGTTFASGMDSNVLQIKLFDENGDQLTNVDPTDLTISTSEDIDAKPFALKQGVYKSEILPHTKSKNIKMQVDWQGKVRSEIVTLLTTVAPLKDELGDVNNRDFTVTQSHDEINVRSGSKSSTIDGFSFENLGPNDIIPSKKKPYLSRYFSFDYPNHARQNIAFDVTDIPSVSDSQSMLSHFLFFPRKNLPLVQQLTGTIDVTLPTGEKVVFAKESKKIMSGVLEEGPIDTNTDRFKRSFATIKYKGKGVVLRANARGMSPQLGEFEKQGIDNEYGHKGAVDVLIINGTTGQRCKRPKSDFWEPVDVSPIEFKFPTDEAFNEYLKEHCGFELPKF